MSEMKMCYTEDTEPPLGSLHEWKEQIKNSITTVEELKKHLDLRPEELVDELNLKFRVTHYYLSLIMKNPTSALRKCVIPTRHESVVADDEETDPLDEEMYMPVPGLVHKYPDRVLFLVTNFCSTNCRYCTRSRIIDDAKQTMDFEARLEYIRNRTEIRDVLLSGGDPLTCSDEVLEHLLIELRKIKHVEIIRIGTKMPVVCPSRITTDFCNMLKKYHPVWMNIHFTHPDEITEECKAACNRLADAGVVLGSQTVLLKGVNDNHTTMKKLMHELVMIRVRPYYLYSCDKIAGSSHFRTDIQTGLDIISKLRGYTSGFCVPDFVVDSKIGKIATSQDNIRKFGDKHVLLGYRGDTVLY